ncbi:stage V sporulation protein S [Paenibacillus sp. FSL H8-0548]|uniref:lasso peptide biosynthesis B2 protein n=1 Tax=Paenibacillus sp. FSL H8-0548 TaxID=1920422 RepID=UPI00096CD5DB|nr:lasso peptide biosynthesis B2 protein [Paenibacillus sp. FSL H8-0548]OMF35932.1 stage V sporulation protein S [Paenibacillus sp. FSL H8-0548]
MEKMMRLKALFSLDAMTLFLLVEAALFLGWARICIAYQPFSKIAPSLGQYMRETNKEPVADHRQSLVQIRSAIHIVSKHTPWDSKCLARAIAGMRMLERRNISSTLYLGTCKDECGKLIAHAWLRSGSQYITGAEEMDRFTVTGMFAKGIHY